MEIKKLRNGWVGRFSERIQKHHNFKISISVGWPRSDAVGGLLSLSICSHYRLQQLSSYSPHTYSSSLFYTYFQFPVLIHEKWPREAWTGDYLSAFARTIASSSCPHNMSHMLPGLRLLIHRTDPCFLHNSSSQSWDITSSQSYQPFSKSTGSIGSQIFWNVKTEEDFQLHHLVSLLSPTPPSTNSTALHHQSTSTSNSTSLVTLQYITCSQRWCTKRIAIYFTTRWHQPVYSYNV